MEPNAMADDCQQNDSMSSKAFSDKPEEITNKENYNMTSSQIDSDLGISFSIHVENVAKVGDVSTSLKRKKSISFDSIENETNIYKKSKIEDESFIDMIKGSDDVKAIALESCIKKQEEFNTAEKLCVTEQKGLNIAEKQEACVTTEQVLSIIEKEDLDITENKGLDVNEILTSVESDKTDDDNTNEPGPINRPEAVKFPKLYRLLREGEDITKGLKAKNPNAHMSVAEHVACGSNGSKSQYISTCSNLASVKTFRNLKLRSRYGNGTKQIVEIDVNELPNNVRIIDLTEESLRKQHEGDECYVIISKFHQHAKEFDEVLLEGSVPSYCLVTASL